MPPLSDEAGDLGPSAQEELLATAVAVGRSLREAAEQAGMPLRRAQALSNLSPRFARRVAKAREEIARQIVPAFVEGVLASVRKLREVLDSGETQVDQVRAAQTLLKSFSESQPFLRDLALRLDIAGGSASGDELAPAPRERMIELWREKNPAS